MKQIAFLVALFIAISFSSCKKTIDVEPEKPKSTKDLVVNNNFDWKTSKEITLNVVGMKDINPSISNVLYIKSSIGDTIYYKEFLNMSQNYVIKFGVPTTENKVILIYGSKIETIDLLSNTIIFDYIIE